MTVGDIINHVFPINAGFDYFTPAVGVEIIITAFGGGNGSSAQIGLADSVNPDSYMSFSYNTTVGSRNPFNMFAI